MKLKPPYATLPLEAFKPDVQALVEKAKIKSRELQQLLYGKDFISRSDSDELHLAIEHALSDFLETTLSPDRDSMRYTPDGNGGLIR